MEYNYEQVLDIIKTRPNKDKIESLRQYSFNIYYFMMENCNFPIMQLKNNMNIKIMINIIVIKFLF